MNIDRYGNTSAASVLLALEEAYHHGRLHPGDTVVLASFGAGLTWAAMALEMMA
jgi:3-oxoacyl-[acyl-carrier-protein] synthase-3